MHARNEEPPKALRDERDVQPSLGPQTMHAPLEEAHVLGEATVRLEARLVDGVPLVLRILP
jgi:hypothetical protein